MIRKEYFEFENVGAGKTAMYEFPLRSTGKPKRILYVGIEVGEAADTAFGSVVGDIEMTINDNPFRLHSATELNQINRASHQKRAVRTIDATGTGNDRTVIPIFLAEPDGQRASDVLGPGLTTDWMNALKLKVSLASALTPTMRGFYVYDEVGSGGKVPNVTKWLRSDHEVTASSKELKNSAFGSNGLIKQFSLFNPTTGTINRVEIQYNGGNLGNLYRNMEAALNQHLYSMNETSGILPDDNSTNAAQPTHIVFDGLGLIDNVISAALLEKMLVTFSAASTGQLRVITQKIEQPS
jgi:hypothetical protein